MNKFILWAGTMALRRLFFSPASPVSNNLSFPKFDFDYLEHSLRRYAFLGSLALVSLSLFAAGTVVALVNLAGTYDQFGTLAPGAVFFTGLGLAALSIVGFITCSMAIRRNRFSKARFLRETIEAPREREEEFQGRAAVA